MKDFLELFTTEERTETIEKIAQKFLVEEMWIADGMYLGISRKGDLKYAILDEEKCKQYESQFLIFGKATHSGSSYAFYKKPNSKNCDEWPIVVMGDEGGVVALAKNIFDLMRFWTLDVAPYVDSSDYRSFDLFENENKEEEDEYSNADYINWVQTEFNLEPLADIEHAKKEIINPAIELYQKIMDSIFDNED